MSNKRIYVFNKTPSGKTMTSHSLIQSQGSLRFQHRRRNDQTLGIRVMQTDSKNILTPDLPGFMRQTSSSSCSRTTKGQAQPIRSYAKEDEGNDHAFLRESFYIPGITGKPRCLLDLKSSRIENESTETMAWRPKSQETKDSRRLVEYDSVASLDSDQSITSLIS